MKTLIMTILIVITLHAQSIEKDWLSLSHKEREVIMSSYYKGLQYNLGFSLAAICWHESLGGRWQLTVGEMSSDYGLYHINIYWYLKEIKVKDTMWNRSRYATILMTQPDVAETYVINKLQTLVKAYNGDYNKVWTAYNGSKVYANSIRVKVKFLQNKILGL